MECNYKVCRSIIDVKSVISTEDNSFDVRIESELPETTKIEKCILGIDEAGRGPVLGNIHTNILRKCRTYICHLCVLIGSTYHDPSCCLLGRH